MWFIRRARRAGALMSASSPRSLTVFRAHRSSETSGPAVMMGTAAAAAAAAAVVAQFAISQPATTTTTTTTEPATGLKFEQRFTVKPDVGCPVSIDFELVGVGARYKFGYVKVYAVGVYLPSTRPLLSGADTLAGVLAGNLNAVVDLQFARQVSADAMIAALDDAVRSRVVAKEGAAANVAGVDEFAALLRKNVGELAPGARLSFMWSGRARDELMVEVNGKIVGTVRSRVVCWALFDAYLGSVPVSPSAKEDVLKNLS